MATRKLLFTGSTVLLAGDMNVDELLLAFAEQPVVFEVGSSTKNIVNICHHKSTHNVCLSTLVVNIAVNVVCQDCCTVSVSSNAHSCKSIQKSVSEFCVVRQGCQSTHGHLGLPQGGMT